MNQSIIIMSCKSPLVGVVYGKDQYSGKKLIKVLPIKYNEQFSLNEDVDIIPIRCGKCIDCRLTKSRDWAMRCMFELETSYDKNNCFFLTLTYDDDHLPSNEKMNNVICSEFVKKDDFDNPWLQIINDASVDETNDDVEKLKLNNDKLPYVHPYRYRDVQLFIKSLRSYFDYKFEDIENAPIHSCRYFGCAEYSPKLRPHFHLIMYDVPLDDLEVKKIDRKTGYIYYVSKTIGDRWNHGFHIITKVCFDTCAYVSQYILKKQYGRNADIYDLLGIPPERVFMSRRPGIGRKYYELHKDEIYANDNVLVKKGDKNFYSKPPKYYDDLYDIDTDDCFPFVDESLMDLIKRDRVSDSILSLNIKKKLNSLSYCDMLESEERIQKAKTKILKERSKIDESSIHCP